MSALGDLLLEHSVRENLPDVSYPNMKQKLRQKVAEVVDADKADSQRTYAYYAEKLEMSERALHDILGTAPVARADESNVMKLMALIQRYKKDGITAESLREEFEPSNKKGVSIEPLIMELTKRKWITSARGRYRPIAEAHLISPPRNAIEKVQDTLKTLVKIFRHFLHQGGKGWEGGGTADARLFTLRCAPGREADAFNRIRAAVLEEVTRIEADADKGEVPAVDLELILSGSYMSEEA